MRGVNKTKVDSLIRGFAIVIIVLVMAIVTLISIILTCVDGMEKWGLIGFVIDVLLFLAVLVLIGFFKQKEYLHCRGCDSRVFDYTNGVVRCDFCGTVIEDGIE